MECQQHFLESGSCFPCFFFTFRFGCSLFRLLAGKDFQTLLCLSYGKTSGNQEITGISIGNVDDIAALAYFLYILFKNHSHLLFPP